jgi:protocatechuate 3,4-dioxygenase beta subunit
MQLSRRGFLSKTLATASALHLAPRAFGLAAGETCTLTAEQEVGPFYVAGELIRSKISEDKRGIPLRLRLVIVDEATCKPIPNAALDLWHCDAAGLYAGYTTMNFGPPPGEGGPGKGGPGGPPPGGPPPGGFGGPGGAPKPTDKLTFCRGIQFTSAAGAAEFQTIFPGFYQGRVNHIHMKVRLDGHRDGNTYAAGHTAHTGQVFFPENLNVKLMAHTPYSEHTIHRTTEAEDHVFNEQHGSMCIATVVPHNPEDPTAGYVAELRIAVNPAATTAPVQGFGGPPSRA